jgi:hypothetical protein
VIRSEDAKLARDSEPLLYRDDNTVSPRSIQKLWRLLDEKNRESALPVTDSNAPSCLLAAAQFLQKTPLFLHDVYMKLQVLQNVARLSLQLFRCQILRRTRGAAAA